MPCITIQDRYRLFFLLYVSVVKTVLVDCKFNIVKCLISTLKPHLEGYKIIVGYVFQFIR